MPKLYDPFLKWQTQPHKYGYFICSQAKLDQYLADNWEIVKYDGTKNCQVGDNYLLCKPAIEVRRASQERQEEVTAMEDAIKGKRKRRVGQASNADGSIVESGIDSDTQISR